MTYRQLLEDGVNEAVVRKEMMDWYSNNELNKIP